MSCTVYYCYIKLLTFSFHFAHQQGPFVQLNELLQLLDSNRIPDSASGDVGMGEGSKTGKRKRGEGEESDEETSGGVNPPVNDIYRSRQQKRVHS